MRCFVGVGRTGSFAPDANIPCTGACKAVPCTSVTGAGSGLADRRHGPGEYEIGAAHLVYGDVPDDPDEERHLGAGAVPAELLSNLVYGGLFIGLTAQVARALNDRRQRAKVRHEVVVMVRQRVHAVASGYGDLNDHDALHHDEVAQTACERDESLASASTLCRFERRAERQWAVAIHQVLVEQFIASHRRAPPVTDPSGLRPSPRPSPRPRRNEDIADMRLVRPPLHPNR